MSTLDKVEKVLTDFLAKIATSEYDEDELFDLQSDVAETVRAEEFADLVFDQDNGVDVALWSAVEDYIGEIVVRIHRKQKDERTKKMAKVCVKRGRAVLERIKKKT